MKKFSIFKLENVKSCWGNMMSEASFLELFTTKHQRLSLPWGFHFISESSSLFCPIIKLPGRQAVGMVQKVGIFI